MLRRGESNSVRKAASGEEKDMQGIKIQESNNVCTMRLIVFQNYSQILLSNFIDILKYSA